jgi:hypothetical protein
MREDRLLKLADVVEADANNPVGFKFDLATWAAPIKVAENPTRYDSGWEQDAVIPLDCNTAACAVGVGCLSGAFKNEGLSYEIDNGMLSPTFQGRTSFGAVREFFEIRQIDVEYLFVSENYDASLRKGRDGELAVAARIRQYVADGGSY